MTDAERVVRDADGTPRAWKVGHNHPVTERFSFPMQVVGYDVRDDYGYDIGYVRRFALGWAAKPLLGAMLLDEDGGRRYWRTRRAAAYALLHIAKACQP